MRKRNLIKNEGWLFQIITPLIGFYNPAAFWILMRRYGRVYWFQNVETGHAFPMTSQYVHSVGNPLPGPRRLELRLRGPLSVDGCNLSLVAS